MNRIAILTFVFLMACSSNHRTDINVNGIEPITIEMTDNSNSDAIHISEIVSNLEFVQLEGVVGGYIKEASRIRLFDNRIFIFDEIQDALFIFRKNGEYITQAIQRGKGPGEVTDASDFDIDTLNKRLLVLEASSKELLVYNLDGKYLFSIKNSFQSYYVSCLGETTYAFYIGYFDPSFHNLFLTSDKGKIKSILFQFPSDIRPMLFEFSGFITGNQEGILYSDACSNNIFQIEKDGNTYLKYRIDFGQRSWPEFKRFEFHDFFMSMSQFNIDYLLKNFEENKDALIFTYQSGNRAQRAFFVKETGVVYRIKKNLVNDLFYNVLSSPRGITDNGAFISVLEPLTVKEKLLEELRNGRKIFMDPDLMFTIINSTELTSNLIVMFYTLSVSKL